MSFFRTRLSAVIAWGMIPLALWAGLPSTACVCANGQLKLVCRHLAGGCGKNHATADHDSVCNSNCCGSGTGRAEADSDHVDCCGGGLCRHDAASGGTGIGSKACCKPILTAPSVAPEIVSLSCDQAPAVIALAEEIGAIIQPSFAAEDVEFDTGPPLDRVIVFRSLLI